MSSSTSFHFTETESVAEPRTHHSTSSGEPSCPGDFLSPFPSARITGKLPCASKLLCECRDLKYSLRV